MIKHDAGTRQRGADSGITFNFARDGAGRTLLLRDGDDAPSPDQVHRAIGCGTAPDAKARRLTDLVEVHGAEIRRRYLAWIHDLGKRGSWGGAFETPLRTATGRAFGGNPFLSSKARGGSAPSSPC